MKAKKPKSIFAPMPVYEMSRNGIRLPDGATDADAFNDLADIGAKLSLPRNPDETHRAYATRLRVALEPYGRDQYVEGASDYTLRMILDLYAPPLTKSETSQRRRSSPTSSPLDKGETR